MHFSLSLWIVPVAERAHACAIVPAIDLSVACAVGRTTSEGNAKASFLKTARSSSPLQHLPHPHHLFPPLITFLLRACACHLYVVLVVSIIMLHIRARLSSRSALEGTKSGNILTLAPRKSPTLYAGGYGPSVPQHDNDHTSFRSIEILPTADEILASGKDVYMPKRDLQEPNPLPAGTERLLDLSFRQLRYESVEKLVDVTYSATQTAFLGVPSGQVTSKTPSNDATSPDPRHETAIGNRYFLYNNVQVEELLAHETLSVLARVSFDCPKFMQGTSIHQTGRFEEGMLVALLCLNTSTNELDVWYLQVHLLQSTHSMTGRATPGRKAAVQLAFLPNTTSDTVTKFAHCAQKLSSETQICMVEYPKVLHAGFFNCLDRLQKLQGFPFSDIIAPQLSTQQVSDRIEYHQGHDERSLYPCRAPKYAEEPEFEFRLNPIAVDGTDDIMSGFTLTELEDSSSIPMIESMTSLDIGQAAAVRHSLKSELAFTQGPPGTGKTHVGMALTRVLLESRPKTSKKPILVVCLTNHALDSFLGGLRDAGVDKLLRIGGGSKEDWTDAINLREKRNKARFSHNETTEINRLREEAKAAFDDIDAWTRGQASQELTGDVGWYALSTFLYNHEREMYDQFHSAAPSPSLVAVLFDFWARGGDLQDNQKLRQSIVERLSSKGTSKDPKVLAEAQNILNGMTSVTTAQQTSLGPISVWKTNANERKRLVAEWTNHVDPAVLANNLGRWYGEHQSARQKQQPIRDARDIRIMEQVDVIGITTTACAGKWDLLNALDLEIVICEEAGEVLEPHVLCTLLPTIQHGIFIGDPQQLRPQVSEYVLSLEKSPDYRLDESLFEKMITPRDEALSALPMAQLNIQRRMHPDIADISRITYPSLQDHQSTVDRESTIGLVERLFWWDHRVPELNDVNVTKSRVNQHEVNMVSGLVNYLLKDGAYSQGDIAVITPYSGQLAALYEGLKATCRFWLNERDRQLLLSEDAFDDGKLERKKEDVPVSDMLRIATVDNFQGEEAKVVVLTTVRSGDKPGFLSVPNRINVACSRAKDSFFIIGNSETLGQVPMWQDIIQLLDSRRGPALLTSCPNHPLHSHTVYGPGDFASVPDCAVPCVVALPCGHMCPENCHPLCLHENDIIPCGHRCEKVLSCGHECPNKCGRPCGPCNKEAQEIKLVCGHEGTKACAGEVSKCSLVLRSEELKCGHVPFQIVCGAETNEVKCQAICEAVLDCGHLCKGICNECQDTGHHDSCKMAKCSELLTCGHRCKADCHAGKDHPRCERKVEITPKCWHGLRHRECWKRPQPCTKPQSTPESMNDCDSTATTTVDSDSSATTADQPFVCCLPTTVLPVLKSCTMKLKCGHLCPSLDDEICPDASLCPECLKQDFLSEYIVYLPDCGHMVDVRILDRMNIQGFYRTNKSGNITGFAKRAIDILQAPKCTVCNQPCPGVRRYEQIGKFVHFLPTVHYFVVYCFSELGRVSDEARACEKKLKASFDIFVSDLRPGPMGAAYNRNAISARQADFNNLIAKCVLIRGKLSSSFFSSMLTDRS